MGTDRDPDRIPISKQCKKGENKFKLASGVVTSPPEGTSGLQKHNTKPLHFFLS
jgi:hypothetical protein